MLQVRLDAQAGAPPPADTFLSVRVGDVQKQTRFEDTRTYNFPESKDSRGSFARVEVFKRIGSTTVCLDNTGMNATSFDVPCSFPDFEKLSLNMFVSGGPADRPMSREKKKKTRASQRMDEAQKYLSSFRLEETLAEAMKEVIRERPDDPYKYLSAAVLKKSGMPPSPPSKSKFSPEVTQKPFQAKADNFPTSPLAAPTQATIASETATMVPSSSQPCAAILPTKAVLPFSAYYTANFQSVLNHASYSKFHSKPIGVKKAVVEMAVAPSTEANTNSKQDKMTILPQILPFRNYYSDSCFTSPVFRNSEIYSKFHSRLVSAPKPRPPFSKMPSVGTWLGYKLAVAELPKGVAQGPANFARLPSVGTWLQSAPRITPPAELQVVEEEFTKDPFPLSPSVGTWLMKEPPDVPRAWYFEQRHHGEHTGYVRQLQKVIATRDDELESLRKQLAEYEGR